MRAITYHRGAVPVDSTRFSLVEKELPVLRERDILVAVKAVSVNPVDTKIRSGQVDMGEAVDVLGFDAAGIVLSVGSEATLFMPGDEVFYSGDLTRAGANAQVHAVDERLVGRKPTKLSFAEAASLPLSAITAWELLFGRLSVERGRRRDGAILILGGAGGVGSVLIQLAHQLTGLQVIATASREESRSWCLSLGAHHVIDHTRDLRNELAALGAPPITHIAALTQTDRHWTAIAGLIAPYGKVGVITNHDALDVAPLRAKSASVHWEDIVTRFAIGGEALTGHHVILNEIAAHVDAGVLRSTARQVIGNLSPASLAYAHALVESGRMTGKVVLTIDL
ncbi:MAG TPA: zinc-binding alcohol dehydrogenase family protein [Steroidobacter sp.]|uniref:zinc-binding alcohol dehydrogenase family protein n=1 Tax=Steroidobacter sp. TaxID=1978227 RepID=UPI002EDB25C8